VDGERDGYARSLSEGLCLDGEGERRPETKRRESQPASAGTRSTQRMEAAWPKPLQASPVHNNPTRRDAQTPDERKARYPKVSPR
jgi:hypothetical protein